MTVGLETRVRDLEIEQAKQGVVVQTLAQAVNENTAATKELTTVLNKSRGAWWALGGLAAAVGYVLSLATELVKS